MKVIILLSVSVAMVSGILALPPMPQDPAYHQFADQRGWAGLPHAWNLLSNIPFLLIGLLGLRRLAGSHPVVIVERMRFIYALFFLALALIGLGSGWYHWSPSNATLVWDRLPIAVAFMCFFSVAIAELVDEKAGIILFPLLLFLGPAAVVYWYWTETLGQGDLRLYILVQLLPMIMLPLLLLGRAGFSKARWYWLAVACYAVAKACEVWDEGLFQLTAGSISGHTLKHLWSGLGAWMIYRSLRVNPVKSPDS